MISPCKPLLLDLLQNDLAGWARYLKTDIRILRKLQDGTGTIQLKTAMRIMERIDKETGEQNNIENFFILSELKGYEKERKVIYEESKNLFTKDDWISIVRYIIEKRWDAFSLSNILLFIFTFALLGIIIYSLFF